TSSWRGLPLSRSTKDTASPSLANNPSSEATSSGRPWNGAVVSSTRLFIKLAPRSVLARPRRATNRSDARLARLLNQGSGLTLRHRQTTLPRQPPGAFMSDLRLTFACGPYDRTQALRDRAIKPEGIELTYLSLQPAEIFW